MPPSCRRSIFIHGNLTLAIAISLLSAPYAIAHQQRPGGPEEARDATSQEVAPPSEATSTSGGQEIIVTATRRSESSTRVPQSILAFDQKSLDQKSVRSIDDLSSLSPGLAIDRSGNGNGSLTNISIRGIVSNSETATTGVYIDDAPVQVRKSGLSLFGTALPALFDLDHVEVLRGPQGTLFGAGSMGGALRFITPVPSLTDYSGYARAEVAATENGGPSGEFGLAVGGPIVTDKIGFRASGYFRHDGGFVDHVSYQTGAITDDNSNRSDTLAFRGAILLAPTERLKITPSLYYQRLSINDTDFYWESLSAPGRAIFKNAKQLSIPGEDEYFLPALKVELDLGFAQFTSLSSYLSRNAKLRNDESNLDGIYFLRSPFLNDPDDIGPVDVTARFRGFSQELRIQSNPGRFQWILGGFYSTLKNQNFQQGDTAFLGNPLIQSIFGVPLIDGKYLYRTTEIATDRQKAAFGEASYEIRSGLRVTLGLRYSELSQNYIRNADGPLYGGPLNYDLRTRDSALTPKVNIAYQIDDRTLIYATAEKGTRAGGVNRAVFPVPACLAAIAQLGLSDYPTSFAPDSLWNYEAGAKGRLFDGKLRFSGAAFYVKWNDIQRQITPPACGGSYFTANLGGATSKGLELSAFITPVRYISLDIQAAYNDAKFDTTLASGNSGYVTAGDTLGTAPWQVTLTGRYERPVRDDLDGYVQAQFAFKSRNRGRTEVQDPKTVSYDPDIPLPDATSVIDLRAGLMTGGIDVALFVDNLLGAHPRLGRYHVLPGDPLFLNRTIRPRTYGLNVSYRF